MSERTAAIKHLSEEVEQQRAAGYETSSSAVDCDECDCEGTFVSGRTVPQNGPVVTPAHDICEVGGGYVYHLQGDSPYKNQI